MIKLSRRSQNVTMQRAAQRYTLARRRIVQAVLLAFGVMQVAPAPAMPTGAQVSAGSAAISSAGSQMTIRQATPRAAINWQQFNIGPGESVQFVQPGASAIALNRVLGQDPSAILGRLSANGQVFLLNPNGVLFGPGAQVNVGGIVASTLNLSDSDFLAGRYGFSGEGGSVFNQGRIDSTEGGYVVLLAPHVTNEGTISAPLGTAALAAGEKATLTLSDNKLLAIAVDRDAVGALVANKQLIRADGGQVILTAKARDALLDTVVNNEGVIEARSASMKNGVVTLDGGASGVTSVSGRIDTSGAARGETGGRVVITGDKVALMPGARIDASGDSGGGTVLVGGDLQGGNPDVRNADRTFVAQSAQVSADATAAGTGGKIVVWGNTSAEVHGKLTASAGSEGGDGGFVETSGRYLDVEGARIEAVAPNGRGGTWLLDPYNLTISGAATGNTDNNTNTAPDWNATGNNAVVQASQIASKLNAGTSVIISTGGVSGGQNGDLTVAASISKTAGTDAALTLRAHDQITLNNNVSISSTTGRLDVTLNADSDGVNGGSIALNNGSSILSNGGNVILGGGANPAITPATGGATSSAYGVLINNATIDATGGSVTINGEGRSTGGANNYGVRMQNAARVQTTGVGTITVTGTGGNGTNTNYGIFLQNTALISSTTGNITLTGQAQGTGTNNMGVRMDNTSAVQTVDGTITVTGTGAAGTTGNNGIYLRGSNAKLAATGAGSVSVTGVAGAGTSNNRGILMDQNDTRIETVSGNVALSGIGNGTGTSNVGVYLNATGVRATSTSGSVTVTGTGGAGTNGNAGVYLNGNGARVESGDGDVTVSGRGAGTGTTNYGVYLQNAARVAATSTGAVTVNGTGGNGTNNNYGVYLQSNNTLIASTTGNIAVTGQAQGLGTNNMGVRMDNTSSVQSVDGAIAVTGTGGGGTNGNNRNAHGVYLAGGNAKVTTTGTGSVTIQGTGGTAGTGNTNSYGVVITGADTRVETGAGNISVTGTGAQTSGGQNYGVYVTGGNARVESAGGNVTVTGTGGAGTTNNYGVYVTGTDARLASTGGNVTVTGTGGAGTNNNYGAYLNGTRARLESASGNVTVTGRGAGTGTNNDGVRLNAGAQVTSTGAGTGAIVMTGTGAGTAPGVRTVGTGTLIGAATHSGDITVSADTATGADSIVLANTSISGTGQLYLQPIDPASTVGVAGGPGKFNLSNTELGYIQNGFDTITIGRTDGSGAMTAGNRAYNADVTLRGATSNITVGTTTMPAPGGNDAGTFTLDTGGAVTQTGPISATNLVLLGAGGTYTLTNAGNAVGTLAASTGSVSFRDSGALTVGTVGATIGVATAGDATIITAPGAGHDITLANGVTSTGGDVVVASGEDIIYGTAAISAGGRWLTYSRSPAQNAGTAPLPGNAMPNLYNRTYAANPPPTITEPGNHNIYSYQPSLTVTADNQNKIYGEPVPTLTATISGLVNGDTAADAYSSAPSLGTTATSTSSVAGSPYPILVGPGTLVSDAGYAFTYVNGQLAVVARPVTITTDVGQTKVYGDPNPAAYSYTITGGPGTTGSAIVPGDTITGVLARAAGENVGAYAINQGTLAVNPAGDYMVTYVGNNFVITPATLQYVADPVSVQAFAPIPSFTGTVTGFKGADTLGNATTGTPVFSTTVPNTFVPGVYPVWGAGLTANNGNYVFVQAPGNATAFDVAASDQGDVAGTVWAQRIERCRDDAFAHAEPFDTLPCALPQDGAEAPGSEQPLVIEGSGIRLPEGLR
jgi:filamentous hemagglutinin family protein